MQNENINILHPVTLTIPKKFRRKNRIALGISKSSLPLLKRLKLRGHVDQVLTDDCETSKKLAENWIQGKTLIIIGAVGAVTRLIAPLIRNKDQDPAVVVLDAKGEWAIPLLGGHYNGAEQQAREIAADLGGTAIVTGACSSENLIAFDSFGHGWGWERSGNKENWRCRAFVLFLAEY